MSNPHVKVVSIGVGPYLKNPLMKNGAWLMGFTEHYEHGFQLLKQFATDPTNGFKYLEEFRLFTKEILKETIKSVCI